MNGPFALVQTHQFTCHDQHAGQVVLHIQVKSFLSNHLNCRVKKKRKEKKRTVGKWRVKAWLSNASRWCFCKQTALGNAQTGTYCRVSGPLPPEWQDFLPPGRRQTRTRKPTSARQTASVHGTYGWTRHGGEKWIISLASVMNHTMYKKRKKIGDFKITH